MEALGQHQQNF